VGLERKGDRACTVLNEVQGGEAEEGKIVPLWKEQTVRRDIEYSAVKEK